MNTTTLPAKFRATSIDHGESTHSFGMKAECIKEAWFILLIGNTLTIFACYQKDIQSNEKIEEYRISSYYESTLLTLWRSNKIKLYPKPRCSECVNEKR